MADEGAKSVTWKATLIGTVMTMATSTAGYVSSHWGGVTKEQAAQDKAELTEKIESSAKSAAAKVEDSMRKYIDKKFEEASIYQPPPRKRKERREQP